MRSSYGCAGIKSCSSRVAGTCCRSESTGATRHRTVAEGKRVRHAVPPSPLPSRIPGPCFPVHPKLSSSWTGPEKLFFFFGFRWTRRGRGDKAWSVPLIVQSCLGPSVLADRHYNQVCSHSCLEMSVNCNSGNCHQITASSLLSLLISRVLLLSNRVILSSSYRPSVGRG